MELKQVRYWGEKKLGKLEDEDEWELFKMTKREKRRLNKQHQCTVLRFQETQYNYNQMSLKRRMQGKKNIKEITAENCSKFEERHKATYSGSFINFKYKMNEAYYRQEHHNQTT